MSTVSISAEAIGATTFANAYPLDTHFPAYRNILPQIKVVDAIKESLASGFDSHATSLGSKSGGKAKESEGDGKGLHYADL